MKQLFYLFLFLTVICSCENVVDVDIEPHESVMTAHCMAGNFAKTTTVCVGYSAGFTDNEEPGTLPYAEIKIKENGNTLITEFYQGPLEGCLLDANNTILDEVGAEYELEIEHPDYGILKAKQVLPEIPEIDEVTYEVVGAPDPFKDADYNRLSIKFTDNPDTKDYYHVHGYIRNQCCPDDFFSVWTWSDNFLLQETVSSQGLIFDDATFNGSQYILDLKVDDTYIDQSVHYIYVKLSKITEDRFLFLRSKKAHDDAQFNPFAEPVTIHSNIEGGYGIFGLEGTNMYFVE